MAKKKRAPSKKPVRDPVRVDERPERIPAEGLERTRLSPAIVGQPKVHSFAVFRNGKPAPLGPDGKGGVALLQKRASSRDATSPESEPELIELLPVITVDRADGDKIELYVAARFLDVPYPEWETWGLLKIPAAWGDLLAMEEPQRTASWVIRERAFLSEQAPHADLQVRLNRRWLNDLIDAIESKGADARIVSLGGWAEAWQVRASFRSREGWLCRAEEYVIERCRATGASLGERPGGPRGDRPERFFEWSGDAPAWAGLAETLLTHIDGARRAAAAGRHDADFHWRRAVEAEARLRYWNEASRALRQHPRRAIERRRERAAGRAKMREREFIEAARTAHSARLEKYGRAPRYQDVVMDVADAKGLTVDRVERLIRKRLLVQHGLTFRAQ